MSPMPSPPPISQEPLRIDICKDAEDLARHAAGLVVAQASKALGARRQFSIALSGGSTPRTMYSMLTQDHYAYQVVWPAAHVYFSDERCVPPGDPKSNYGSVRDTILTGLRVPEANLHRMRGEDDPASAAAEYEKVLRAGFEGMPQFDLVLLGMGSDGHTASLFPGSPALSETERLVAATRDPEGLNRITLTLPAINAAHMVAVLVSGREKAAMLQRVLGVDARAEGLPIQQVRPAGGQLVWVIDEAAASLLDPPMVQEA